MSEEEHTAFDESDQLEVAEAVDDTVERLCPGRPLNSTEADSIARASRARLIVMAGMPQSGKTTLIASLFHCFQHGPFADYMFAGSVTLLGFDERCHDARVRSQRSVATTERTKAGVTESLLHLKVMHRDHRAMRDVLFVDVSGEHYEAIRDSVDECRAVPCIRRADHFVVLIDGQRLADPNQRQTAKTNARMVLQSCFDSGELKPSALVDILISKWDQAQDSAEIESFVATLESDFRQRFEGRCVRLRIQRIAARPTTDSLPLGWNMADVFSGWVEDVPEDFAAPIPCDVGVAYTEFDRFVSSADGRNSNA